MSSEHFDTIIVGARCAGASLAARLARDGQKVLLLDAAHLPSNQASSTHFVQAYGVELLDELGVGEKVRGSTPASPVMRIELNDIALDVPVPGGRASHCVRRCHLDELLQNAAVAAGASLRDRSKARRLLRDGDRVVGVVVSDGNSCKNYHARMVVGADGRDSTVAKLASAKEYSVYEAPRFTYWSYWRTSPGWKERVGFNTFDAYLGFAADRTVRFVFQTDSNLLLMAVAPPLSELPSWRGRQEARYLETLRGSPLTAALVEETERDGGLFGVLRTRYFFREAVGPGFALVGDAGLHKDPTLGLGITDALRDARNLSVAILDGGEAALSGYWRQRDRDSVDLFHFSKEVGDPNYVNPLSRLVFERVQKAPNLVSRIGASIDRQLSPYAALPALTVTGWVLGALLRGNWSVLPSFFARAKLEAIVKRARREQGAERYALAGL